MNRKRAHWSVMGIEPQEKRVKQEDFQEFEKKLNIMFGKYEITDVLNAVRKVHDINVGKVEG